jgi:uncharacterized glyoxalase superfamily protein PhnB
MLKKAIPVLHVTSSAAAEEYYCGKLGFTLEFIYRPDVTLPDPAYMGVMRDGAGLHISSFPGDGVAGSAIYIDVDDVDAIHKELVGKGVLTEGGPIDQTWGRRELMLRDADWNRITFGQ